MQQIGNINVLDIENLFHEEEGGSNGSIQAEMNTVRQSKSSGASQPVNPSANMKLSYSHYCAVT